MEEIYIGVVECGKECGVWKFCVMDIYMYGRKWYAWKGMIKILFVILIVLLKPCDGNGGKMVQVGMENCWKWL